MARFRYVAKNMEGRTCRGTMNAPSEAALQQMLKEQGLYLAGAKELGQEQGRRRLGARQLAQFNRELSNLLGSGITIVRALDIISQEEGTPEYAKSIYRDVLADLKKGISLSEAMETKGCFPELMLGMVRSGEGSGNLELVTERLAGYYEKDYKMSQQLRSAMTYPAILLVLAVGVVILIMTFILPQFQSLFDQMEELPAITQFLMDVSDFLIHRWYVVLLGAALLVIVFRILLSISAVRERLDYAKVHLPVISRLNKTIYTARFARTLSSLYSSGMPISGALRAAGETIGNRYVEEQFAGVYVNVRSGVPLSKALQEVDGLLGRLSSTILIGEESGRLDNMLDSVAATLEDEADQATKRLVTLLEPLLICLMALVVGFIMVAVMLPIIQSYGAIEGAA